LGDDIHVAVLRGQQRNDFRRRLADDRKIVPCELRSERGTEGSGIRHTTGALGRFAPISSIGWGAALVKGTLAYLRYWERAERPLTIHPRATRHLRSRL